MDNKHEAGQLARFREALSGESIYPTTKSICDYIINTGERILLRKYDILIDYNEMNDNVYFILEGIMRLSIISDKGTERTEGFGLCGSMVCSTQCYTLGKPSLVQLQACCDTVLLKIPKTELSRHIVENHEFCLWIYGMSELTVCYREMRSYGFTGDAAVRYRWLKEERPEILKKIPAKIIASYLNISEVHLSRIKRKLLNED